MSKMMTGESDQRNEIFSTQVKSTHGKTKYLTFFLGKEEFGIEISRVIEIIGVVPTVFIPQLPGFYKGVINLRGSIIPVMDLRSKLGMESIETTGESVIIIVQSNTRRMGLLADRVTEVLDINAEDIEETPEFDASISNRYIMGIGKKEEAIKILLDIDQILEESIAKISGPINNLN